MVEPRGCLRCSSQPPPKSTILPPPAFCRVQSPEFIRAYTRPSAGMAHGLVFLPVLLSLVGPGEISVGAPAVREAQPATAGKDGVAMGSVDSSTVNEA